MTITNLIAYKEAFHRLDAMIAQGFEGNEQKEAEFKELALAIEAYEDSLQLMPLPPQTLAGMIELKMYERKLKQKELAELLEISATRLSEILNGKRKINLELAKKLYERLQISPEFILKSA